MKIKVELKLLQEVLLRFIRVVIASVNLNIAGKYKHLYNFSRDFAQTPNTRKTRQVHYSAPLK